ncbi:MAG: hypothetical protein R3Y07_10955, partial [Eubacteriales bacterium]
YYSRTVDEMVVSLLGNLPNWGVMSAFLFGLFGAMCAFRYLYDGKSANMIHSIPTRREGLFLTQYLAGACFLLVPNLINLIASMMALGSQGGSDYGALVTFFWLLSLLGMFFYNFAVFCAMFTGAVAGLPLFYLIYNWVAKFVSMLISPILETFLVGFRGFNYYNSDFIQALTPTSILMNYVDTTRYGMSGEINFNGVYTYVAVSFGMVAISFALFRVRHLERAGDAVSVKCMRPVFRFCVSLIGGVAAAIASVSLLFSHETTQVLSYALVGFTLLWGIVCYFVAEMILRKTYRVLNIWKQALLMGGVILGLYSLLLFDLTGYEGKIPAQDEVSFVTITTGHFAPSDSFTSGIVLLPEEVEIWENLHRSSLESAREARSSGSGLRGSEFTITYQLLDGSVLEREYWFEASREGLESEGSIENQLISLSENREVVARSYPFDEIPKVGAGVNLYHLYDYQKDESVNVTVEGATAQLLEALEKDFAEGTVGIHYLSELATDEQIGKIYDTYVNLTWTDQLNARSRNMRIHLTPDSQHTLALLDELGHINSNIRPYSRVDKPYSY